MYFIIIIATTMTIFHAEGQQCNGRNFEDGVYNYTIRNNQLRSILESIQIANVEGNKLLTIEGPEQQRLLQEQMRNCTITQAWLGIKQVAPHRLLQDSGPWSWISDCTDPDAGVIGYQGCYFENNDDRDLPEPSYLASSEVTIDSCTTRCGQLGQKYAGILDSPNSFQSCYCGQSYGKHGAAIACGGIDTDRHAVYHTKSNPLWGEWLRNYPNDVQPYSYCGFIHRNHGFSNSFILGNENCDKRQSYICEFKVEENASTCGEWADFSIMKCNGSTCYCISQRRSPKSWHKAKFSCSKYGGKLVVIESRNEHNFVTNWLLENSNIPDEIWVGISRETFQYHNSNNTVCYTNFNQNLDGSGTFAYMKTNDGSWRTVEVNDANASTITQLRKSEETTLYVEAYPTTEQTVQDSTELSQEEFGQTDSHGEEIGQTDSQGGESGQTDSQSEEIGQANPQVADETPLSPWVLTCIIVFCLVLLAVVTGKCTHWYKKRGCGPTNVQRLTNSNIDKTKQPVIQIEEQNNSSETEQLSSSVESSQLSPGVASGANGSSSDTDVINELTTNIQLCQELKLKDGTPQDKKDSPGSHTDEFVVLATVLKMNFSARNKTIQNKQPNSGVEGNVKDEVTSSDSNTTDSSISSANMLFHGNNSSSVEKLPRRESKTLLTIRGNIKDKSSDSNTTEESDPNISGSDASVSPTSERRVSNPPDGPVLSQIQERIVSNAQGSPSIKSMPKS